MCRPKLTCMLSSVESFSVNGSAAGSGTPSRAVLPAMTTARYRPKASVFRERLYVVGGRGGVDFSYLDSGEALDLHTMRWTVLPRLFANHLAVLSVFPFRNVLHILAANASMPNTTTARIKNCSSSPCKIVELPDTVPQYGNPGIVLRGNMAEVFGGRLCFLTFFVDHEHECLPPKGNLAVNLITRKVRRGGPPGSLPDDRRRVQEAATVSLGDDVGILVMGGQQVVEKARISTDAVKLFNTKWAPPSTSTTPGTTPTPTPTNTPPSSQSSLTAFSLVAVLVAVGFGILIWRHRSTRSTREDDDEELIELQLIGSADDTTTSSAASSGSGIGLVTFTWSAANAPAKPYLKPQDIQPTPSFPYPQIEPMILRNPLGYPPILSSREEAVSLVVYE